MKKRRLAVIAAALGTVILAGCGQGAGGSESTQDTQSTTQAETQAAQAGEEAKSQDGSSQVIQIDYPTFMCGTASVAGWFQERCQAFNEQYAGKYEIVVEEIPNTQDYVDKMKVLYSSDSLPDVLNTGGYNIIDMMQDKLVDLTPYVDDEWRGTMSEIGIKVNSRDGKLYGIPSTRQLVGYFYNKELFAQAGITEPAKTWDEFFEQCEALKQAGIVPMSMDTADSGWCTSLFLGAMTASNEAGEEFMNTLQPKDYNVPEFIDAVKKIQVLFQEYTTPDSIGGDYAAAANNFQNEITAMIANGPWMVQNFYDTTKCEEGFYEKVGTAMYPEGTMYNAAQTGWHVAAKTPEKIEAAIEMIKFMTSEESQKLYLEMTGNICDRNLTSDQIYPLVNEVIENASKSTYNINDYQSLWYANVVDEVSVQYPLLAQGEMTPEEFAAALTAAAEKNEN